MRHAVTCASVPTTTHATHNLPAHRASMPPASEAFKRFLARVKTAGVFKGAAEGTPEYDAVYKVVVQKFKARQQQKVRARAVLACRAATATAAAQGVMRGGVRGRATAPIRPHLGCSARHRVIPRACIDRRPPVTP